MQISGTGSGSCGSSGMRLSAAQAARAYGMRIDRGREGQTVGAIRPSTERFADTAIQSGVPAAAMPAQAGTVNSLVAARVKAIHGNRDAMTPAVPGINSANGGALQMYRRAADKIEAAVAIEVGRMIDLKG